VDIIDRGDLELQKLKGFTEQKAVGPGGLVDSSRFQAGFQRYSGETGQMEAQQLGEEIIYVVDSKDGWVQSGPSPDQLEARITAQAGWLLHCHAGEWTRFGYDPDGYLDILYVRES
jgi:hypothetical protein